MLHKPINYLVKMLVKISGSAIMSCCDEKKITTGRNSVLHLLALKLRKVNSFGISLWGI